MKKVLLIQSEQFGKLTDTVKYCEYLAGMYRIDILTFDYGVPHVKPLMGVNISYIHHFHSKIVNAVLFFTRIFLRLLFHGYQCVWIEYFPHCSIVSKVFRKRKVHIDVRTLSVDRSLSIRQKENLRMRKDLLGAGSVSFISEGIKKQLNLQSFVGKTYILPLGADIISSTDKKFDSLSVLYVGTLRNRRILDTVKGMEMFIGRHPSVPISYLIVGNGDQSEFNLISDYISEKGLENIVQMTGYVPYSEMKPYFDSHNVGLSYVPEYECYQDQPPTKTYEYVLSGLYCMATKTRSNVCIINEFNGILHDDNPESLCSALEQVWTRRNEIDSKNIRRTLIDSQWRKIVENSFIPIIEAD